LTFILAVFAQSYCVQYSCGWSREERPILGLCGNNDCPLDCFKSSLF